MTRFQPQPGSQFGRALDLRDQLKIGYDVSMTFVTDGSRGFTRSKMVITRRLDEGLERTEVKLPDRLAYGLDSVDPAVVAQSARELIELLKGELRIFLSPWKHLKDHLPDIDEMYYYLENNHRSTTHA